MRKTKMWLQVRIERFCISQEGGNNLLPICWGVYPTVHLAGCHVGSREIRSLSTKFKLLKSNFFLKKIGWPKIISQTERAPLNINPQQDLSSLMTLDNQICKIIRSATWILQSAVTITGSPQRFVSLAWGPSLFTRITKVFLKIFFVYNYKFKSMICCLCTLEKDHSCSK